MTRKVLNANFGSFGEKLKQSWTVLILVNFGGFSPSGFLYFLCNAMRKSMKLHKNLHANQQNEHTPGDMLPVNGHTYFLQCTTC